MKPFIIFISLAVYLAAAGSWAKNDDDDDDGGQLAPFYEQINAYLEAQLAPEQQDNVELMMAKVEELRDQSKDGDHSLLLALQQVLELSSVVDKDGNKCSREAFEVLKRNNQATRGLAQVKSSSSMRPIDKLVRHYLVKQATRCQKVYLERFKRIYRKQTEIKFLDHMEPLLARLIESQLEARFGKSFEQLKPRQMVEGLMGISGISEQDASIVHEELTRIVPYSDEKRRCLRGDSKGEFDKQCLASLISKYFGKPCEKNFVRLGPEVFEPAIFNQQMLSSSSKPSKLSLLDFHFGWATFNLCKSLQSANGLGAAEIFVIGADHQN